MRARLALLVAAAMTLVLAGFMVPLAMLIRSVTADHAVTSATIEAQSLASLIATTDRASLRLAVDQMNETAQHKITVFLPDGTAIGADAERTPGVALAARGRSISVATARGREILVAVEGLRDGTAVIRTFVAEADLRRGVPQTWLILGLLGAALLAVGVVVADALARFLVRPIGELAQVSHRLAAGRLDARAVPAGPREVQEVAAALNHLAGRIQDLVRQERETVADMSHRLRTPLTALRLQVESASAAIGAARFGPHFEALEDAITRLIEDTRRRGAGSDSCDAAEVVAERAAFWAVLAEDQDRLMRTDLAAPPMPVRAPAADLAACVDALLGNVFAHTPEGTALAVTLTPGSDGGAIVKIEDAGPGFGLVDPSRRGWSGGGSTGLGLDIARQTAEASGGRLTAGRSAILGGAQVVVQLGAVDDRWSGR